jgi:hypothetical protein
MAPSINVSDVLSNVDAGDYLVAVVLKDAAGAVIGSSPDAPVTVPASPDVPVLPPPTVTPGP